MRLSEYLRQVQQAQEARDKFDALAPGGWIYEDELPEDYPYDAMFPYSRVDGVRLFPRLPDRNPNP